MLTNNVRLATQEDVDTIVSLGFDFWVETPSFRAGIPYNHDSCKRLASIIVDTGIALIAGDYGMLLMLTSPHPFNHNFTVASEIAFYIKPENRKGLLALKMIRAAEDEARNMGVNHISMAYIEGYSPKGITRLYSHLGYSPSEGTFSKML